MQVQPNIGATGCDDRRRSRGLAGIIGLILVLQLLLAVKMLSSYPDSVPLWLVVTVESLAGVIGLAIVYLSAELSRIRRVGYPLLAVAAFGATTVVSIVIVISSGGHSAMGEFTQSELIIDDLYLVGRYVLVAPLAFVPFALTGMRQRDGLLDRALLPATALMVTAAGLLLVLTIEEISPASVPMPEGGTSVLAHWFAVALALSCFTSSLSGLRLYRSTANRLLLGTVILLSVVGLTQGVQSFLALPSWFETYCGRMAEVSVYVVFGLIVLGEYVGGHQRSAAVSAQMNLELQRKTKYLQVLMESTKLLNSALDVSRVQAAVLEAAIRLLNATAAALIVYDEASGLLVPRHVVGNPDLFPKNGFPPTEGIAGRVFSARKAEFIPDVAKDPQALVRHFDGGAVSLMSVPLVIGGKAVAVLSIVSPMFGPAQPPTGEQVELLSALATHAAIALEHARSFERTAAMHEQLKLAGLQLEAVIDSMPEGVCIAEAPSGKIILANSAAVRILGEALLSDLPMERHPEAFSLFRASGEPFPYEEMPVFRSIRNREVCCGVEIDAELAPSRKMTLLMNSAPMEDTRGNVVGAVMVFQDVTRQRQVERMKDDFLSLVSHDLKTPLTTIKGYASTLLQDDVEWTEEEQKRFIRIIGQEADKLTSRVQDLLDVSLIASGTLSINKSWCNIRDLVEVTVEKLGSLLVDRQVYVDVAEDLTLAPIDPARIKQVLRNLIENAVKYSHSGSNIRVAARVEDASLLVSVTDQGIGIDPSDLPRVFDRFSRLQDASRRSPGGKGLGLAICQGIIQAHGGRLWAESSVGLGSTFGFSLPILDGDIAEEE